MYNQYFGFEESPFSIAPDPRYLFMTKRHREAWAHLQYGLKEGGGFVQLTGEVGTGKTTLVRALLENLPPNVDIALVLNPKLTALEFVETICDELKIDYPKDNTSLKVLTDGLNAWLLQAHGAGRRVVLLVDEAQNFNTDVLEQIRLLTNLETTKDKLLQIILVGQPELRTLLARRDQRQLAQRITARYHLIPLSLAETHAYIEHRLKVAGVTRRIFNPGAIRQIHRYSAGIPRLVNVVCDRALLAAYSQDVLNVTASMVKATIADLGGTGGEGGGRESSGLDPARWMVWAAAGLTTIALVAVVGVYRTDLWSSKPPVVMAENFSGMGTSKTEVPVESAKAAELPGPATLPTVDTASNRIGNTDQFIAYLNQTPAAFDLNAAFTNLFALWAVDYQGAYGATGCEKATSSRLGCHWAQGSWDQFLRLNQPALVWQDDETGERKRYFVVAAVRRHEADVDVGESRWTVSTDVLKSNWPGKYLVLWRPPALDVELIRPGDRGQIVVWLRRNLERVQGVRLPTVEAEVFDPLLVESVRTFQHDRLLVPDGLVGEQTLIHLSAETGDVTIPLLTGSSEN